MEEMNYLVYKHTNKENGKCYIGITGRAIKERWLNGRGYKKCPYFSSALKKYGWDSFDHEILIHGLTKEQAEKWEIRLIAYYKSNDTMYGYNCTRGGEYRDHSKKGKEKISKASIGGNNVNAKEVYSLLDDRVFGSATETAKFYGIKDGHYVSEECRGKRKIQRFVYKVDYDKLSEEQKEFLKNRLQEFLDSGKVFNYVQRKVISLVDGKVFDNTKQCCLFYNLGFSVVFSHCKGQVKLQRFMYLEDYLKLTNMDKNKFKMMALKGLEFKNRKLCKPKSPVRSSKMNNKIISLIDRKIFDNGAECANYYNLQSVANIGKHCRKCVKLQKFMFLDEFNSLSFSEQQELFDNVKKELTKPKSKRNRKFLKDPYEHFKKKVVRVADGKLYESIKACSDDNDVGEHIVSRHCNHKCMHQDYMFLSDYEKLSIIK